MAGRTEPPVTLTSGVTGQLVWTLTSHRQNSPQRTQERNDRSNEEQYTEGPDILTGIGDPPNNRQSQGEACQRTELRERRDIMKSRLANNRRSPVSQATRGGKATQEAFFFLHRRAQGIFELSFQRWCWVVAETNTEAPPTMTRVLPQPRP